MAQRAPALHAAFIHSPCFKQLQPPSLNPRRHTLPSRFFPFYPSINCFPFFFLEPPPFFSSSSTMLYRVVAAAALLVLTTPSSSLVLAQCQQRPAWISMSASQKNQFVSAISAMKASGKYDTFVAKHLKNSGTAHGTVSLTCFT